MNTYLAITLGPIFKTFKNVRKTRELWAASYIFSYISKRLIEKIIAANKQALLIPHYDENSPVGIGLYPDRIFLRKCPGINIEALEDFKKEVLQEISEWIDNGNSLNFLIQYFRIYAVEYAVTDKENPLLVGNTLLDTAELRSTWELNQSKNELLHFFRTVNTLKKSDGKKWIKDHFAEADIYGETRFESLPEISTRAIRNFNKEEYKRLVKEYCYQDKDKDDDESFIKNLQKTLNPKGQPERFKNYHKYVCIVKADGDRVGKYIKSIDSDYEKNLSDLSRSLYDWGIESARLITDYAGVPVYIGGDDVLFLAPVVGKNEQTILELARDLNKSFERNFEVLPVRIDKEDNVPIKPTLSFGISITYYKYPLYEALEKADELLYKAKETRNTCSVSLLKHSGSSFDISISNDENDKNSEAFQKVNQFFVDDQSFVSSIMHHFRENESIYRIIGTKEVQSTQFLNNNFEDEKHENYVNSIAKMAHGVYEKSKNETDRRKASQKSVQEIHSLLRILKFLNGQEDGK
jgi:CRISPR-associated protein Cmr2